MRGAVLPKYSTGRSSVSAADSEAEAAKWDVRCGGRAMGDGRYGVIKTRVISSEA